MAFVGFRRFPAGPRAPRCINVDTSHILCGALDGNRQSVYRLSGLFNTFIA